MLNIYYGRESVDKEKFIFEEIKRTGFREKQPVVVIVPDQYTLESERAAFACMDKKSLIGLDVYSFSRLGHKVLSELGGIDNTFIDKYGRQMLLMKVIGQQEDLELFKGNAKKSSFIELANDFISELKQYEITPKELKSLCESMPEEELLTRKLREIFLIYDMYEREIAGKYTDSEDFIDIYTEKIPESSIIKGSKVWIYGFDSFSPKNMHIIKSIMSAAETVNVVLTYDENCRDEELFALSAEMMKRLRKAAGECDCEVDKVAKIETKAVKAGAIEYLEKELFAIDTVPADFDPAKTSSPQSPNAFNKTSDPVNAAQRNSNPVNVDPINAAPVNAASISAAPVNSTPNAEITVCEAANMYSEAESAAEFILRLLRDEGYRYRDIVMICNDSRTRSGIISRVFEEYGIPLFHDTKRKIINSAPAVYLVSMLETVLNGYRTSDIFRTLKSGMITLKSSAITLKSGMISLKSDVQDPPQTPGSDGDVVFPGEEIEQLENYALKYRIRGSMWKRPFKYGSFEYGKEELESLESLRKEVIEIFTGLERIIDESVTVREFIENYYNYLMNELDFESNLSRFMNLQSRHGAVEYAEETRQILNMLVSILEQLVELIGDDAFARGGNRALSFADFVEIFRIGLSEIEVGRIPSSIDDLMLGTMKRTRSGNVKAIVVVGANEGVLPEAPTDEGLLAFDELDRLSEAGVEICKSDKIRMQEERLAIYRNLCKPTKHLWISYSRSDEEGKETRRSGIVDTICAIFPGMVIEKDIVNRDDEMALIGGKFSTLRYLSERMRADRYLSGDEAKQLGEETLSPHEHKDRGLRDGNATHDGCNEHGLWEAVKNTYEKAGSESLREIQRGLSFRNRPETLDPNLTGRFFKEDAHGSKILSSSRLEKYAHCPFSYYVSRILSPVEFREFRVAGREIGDVYHACIMKVTEVLSRDDLWHSVSEEECERLVDKAVEEETANYRDGLFSFGNEESYKLKRIKETCLKSLKILIEHVRKGKIKSSLFEVGFGKNRRINPIVIDVGAERKNTAAESAENAERKSAAAERGESAGKRGDRESAGKSEVFIEGIIDRVDYLENGRVKIIDYKSGENTISKPEIEAGYRLQLMLYMKAAQEHEKKPAGVFYFHIQNPRFAEKPGKKGDEPIVENLKKNLMREFRLEGFVVDDLETIRCIDGEFESKSDVMKVDVDKKNNGFKGRALLSEEEFKSLQDAVEDRVKRLIEGMNDGKIDISPMKVTGIAKSGEVTACDYCDYRSICRFDTQFEGCEYNVVK